MSGPMEDAAAAGAPESPQESASAEPLAPRVSRAPTPPPRGRPGLAWDGRGTLGRAAPLAHVRAAPVPQSAAPEVPRRPPPVLRVGATTTGGELALDLRRGGSVASFGRRAVGFVADELTVRLIVLVLLVVGDVGLGGVIALGLVVPLGYRWLFDSLGWSPGKLAAGLRLVNARGEPPGTFAGGTRSLVALLVPFYLSYLWAAWDPRVQTLHDRAARTYVVPVSVLDERPARP